MTRIRIDIDSNFGQVAETIQNLSSGPVPPPPEHRHGRDCPQCHGWTWKMTQWCVHCGADIFSLDRRERALRSARRRFWFMLVCLSVSGTLMWGQPHLPQVLQLPAMGLALLSMLAGAATARAA